MREGVGRIERHLAVDISFSRRTPSCDGRALCACSSSTCRICNTTEREVARHLIRFARCPTALGQPSLYTRIVYRRLAARIARDMLDYVRSGFEVVGVVGIGGSPSRGVNQTLDLKRSLPVIASMPIEQLDREAFNDAAIARCVTDGQGLFIQALERELDRRGLHVAFLEHDLIAEMCGEDAQLSHDSQLVDVSGV